MKVTTLERMEYSTVVVLVTEVDVVVGSRVIPPSGAFPTLLIARMRMASSLPNEVNGILAEKLFSPAAVPMASEVTCLKVPLGFVDCARKMPNDCARAQSSPA